MKVLADILIGAGLVLAGWWVGYKHGRMDGWHRGSSDTAAYIANSKDQ